MFLPGFGIKNMDCDLKLKSLKLIADGLVE